MDCDLQDNPKYIPDLLSKSKEGYDIVFAIHKDRKHGKFKNLFSGLFHLIFNWLVGVNILRNSGQIGAYSLLTLIIKDSNSKKKTDYIIDLCKVYICSQRDKPDRGHYNLLH